MVFRVFVFHTPFPEVDLGDCCEDALGGMAFLPELGGCTKTS